MTTTSNNIWSFSIEGLTEIQIDLRNAHLRLFRNDAPEVSVRLDNGEEIGDWLQVEHTGGALAITQRGAGVRSGRERFGFEGDIHEAVHGALSEVFDGIDTVAEAFEGFGERFEDMFSRRPGRAPRAPRAPRVSVPAGHGFHHGHLSLSVGIPAALEMPQVMARLDRGDVEVEDLWGRLAVRTGLGSLTLTRCGRECAVKTGRGAVTLTDCSGRLEAHSGLGDMHLSGCDGTAEVHTGKGAVRLERCRLGGSCNTGHGDLWLDGISGDGRFHTGAGSITALNVQGGDLDLNTGMGEVVVQGGSVRELRAHSGAGSLRCTGIEQAEKLDVVTGMGNIVVEGGTVGWLRMKGGAGNLECATALGPSEHELETGAGNIEVRLASDARVRVDAVTRMGQVHSDFGLVKVGRPGPATVGSGRFVGSIGDGEATASLYLKTGAGNIAIRRAENAATHAYAVPTSPRAGAATAQQAGEGPERTRLEVLHSLQRGEITVEEAMALLERLG